MEAITIFAPKHGFQLSLASRTHLSPVSELTRFPLTACPIKPTKIVSSKATILSCDGQESNRKFKNFGPSGWNHLFHSVLVDASEMDALRREMDTLKPYVEKKLMSSHGIDSTKQSILMIYLLVSLGIAYHFEDEIEEILKEGFGKIEEIMAGEDDLYTVSIIFWVFRTYGHHMSSDVFRKFKGNNGKFKECLSGDAKGMLALYEAAQLRTTTDDIMEEALSFVSSRLEVLATDGMIPPHLSMHIRNALGLSQHKNMEILVAIEYIPFYEKEEDHDKMLLKFAKLNFNLMQLHYIEELKIVTKWYEDQDFVSNLPPYFKDVQVANHFYAISMHMEPKLAKERIMLTKIFTVLVLLDDTFDRYASLPEAESLTNSLGRWTPDVAMDRQPDYLKFVFKFVVNCFEEFEREVTSERSYSLKATRELFNIYVRSNLELAKWVQAGHLPSFEEYMKVGEIEIAIYVCLAVTFMGMDIANEKVYEWFKSIPKLVQTICQIGRLLNDVTGFEDDMSRGYATTGVNIYMKQYGVTETEAIRELHNLIVYYDKIVNDEFLKEIDVPCQIRKKIYNIIQTGYVAYNEGEGYTYPEGKLNEYITSVFVTRIPL